jgi:hypothetical protein
MRGFKTFRLAGGVNGVGTVWCGVVSANALHIGQLRRRSSVVEQPLGERKVGGSNTPRWLQNTTHSTPPPHTPKPIAIPAHAPR